MAMLRNTALACLVVQNAGIILLTKFSFRSEARPYSQASAVLLAELLKLFSCLLLELRSSDWSVGLVRKSMRLSLSNAFMILPASLYVVQNLAQLRAINGLSPAVYVTGIQLKVLTAAIFSACLLRRSLNRWQIISFFPLMAGVALVQYEHGGDVHSRVHIDAVLFLLLAVTLSGLAGVMLETSFKQEGESVWVKNTFLSTFSVPPAFFAAILEVKPKGLYTLFNDFYSGFDLVVWIVVTLLALGGLLTALVMKHAGALTKCYAVSVSIIICTVVSSITGVQTLTSQVFLGSILVIPSVFLYASSPRSRQTHKGNLERGDLKNIEVENESVIEDAP